MTVRAPHEAASHANKVLGVAVSFLALPAFFFPGSTFYEAKPLSVSGPAVPFCKLMHGLKYRAHRLDYSVMCFHFREERSDVHIHQSGEM